MAAESKTWRIAVANRKDVVDAVGESLRGDILDLGINGVERVRHVRLYTLHGELSTAELDRITTGLLADPVTQEHLKIDAAGLPVESGQWGVEVWFRQGVTDAVGETALKGSRDLGVTGIESVDTGRGYILGGPLDRPQIDTICRRLLANDVIERYECYEGGQ
ncbi:MAG: phosphoribosylformylglycinamidine synthase subunit PurS [Gemmatimonadetes bacterium]|nr:phosphoribosylformylglycinamidine synthase subunit PurS [Gemmatimonadota bacterium]